MQLHRASHFTLQQLTDAYNQTRVDYIVPMPMNVARLQEYIDAYDIDLEASWVAMDGKIIFGLGMLGVRRSRAWITRVGVLPIGRRQGTGRAIVNKLIESAGQRRCRQLWIEVIAGNKPAQQLFLTGGFHPEREMLVARRPPSHTSPLSEEGLARGARLTIAELEHSEVLALLSERHERPNWLNETESFRSDENIRGLSVGNNEVGQGWVVYKADRYQLTHIVVEALTGDPAQVAASVLQGLHRRYPTQDAVLENLPADSPLWSGFQSLGYFEVFRRQEMFKRLAP
ncbi:MAG: GNAT family N-acetyltransferase [Chloroflexota bacterium]|nr:MAG: GNAT family N-acetyltransferase [Chloroflexota bacterium]